MRSSFLMMTTLGLCLLAGCAPQTKYAWGGYETSLYQYYKNPTDKGRFVASLEKTIHDAEANGQKVPPGIYAEYGHMLLVQGKSQEAVQYFEKEKKAWPESTVLMTTMIEAATVKTQQPMTTEKK